MEGNTEKLERYYAEPTVSFGLIEFIQHENDSNSTYVVEHFLDPRNTQACAKFLDGNEKECELWNLCCKNAIECCKDILNHKQDFGRM